MADTVVRDIILSPLNVFLYLKQFLIGLILYSILYIYAPRKKLVNKEGNRHNVEVSEAYFTVASG